jgi:hypothetical protein
MLTFCSISQAPGIGQSIHDPLSHKILKHCLSGVATIPRRYQRGRASPLIACGIPIILRYSCKGQQTRSLLRGKQPRYAEGSPSEYEFVETMIGLDCAGILPVLFVTHLYNGITRVCTMNGDTTIQCNGGELIIGPMYLKFAELTVYITAGEQRFLIEVLESGTLGITEKDICKNLGWEQSINARQIVHTYASTVRKKIQSITSGCASVRFEPTTRCYHLAV